MTRTKRRFRNYHALLIGIFLSLVLAECIVRFVPNSANNYGTTIGYEKREGVGYSLVADPAAICNLSCTRINNIHVNSLGFRDAEWKKDEKFKIAIMGDSYLEALQVADSDHTATLLEKILGVEVMNASISGYGTVAQYLAYKNLIKQFHPKVVIVFFCRHNDFMNNECHLDVLTGNYRQDDCPCAIVNTKGGVELLSTYPADVFPVRKPWLEKKWMTYAYIKQRFFPVGHFQTKETMQFFFEPWAGRLKETEVITKEVLNLFKKEVEADGAKFYIISVPTDFQTSGDQWKEVIKGKTGWDSIPLNFNLKLPSKKLEEISNSIALKYFSLDEDFNSFLDSNQIPNRMLSFPCNNHWSPLGHFVAAHATALHLLSEESFGLDSLKKNILIEKIAKNLQKNPHEILSEKTWKEIYEGGIYMGDSKVYENTVGRK